jgi:hypothetical protein
MTVKAPKPVPHTTATLAVEADERHQGDVDTFIERNRDALNTSIRRSRIEVAKGVRSVRSIDKIVADGRKRHSPDIR